MAKIKVRPLQDRIIVERLEPEESKRGDIIIPDTAKEKPQEGRVVAIGSGKVLENGSIQPLEVKEGDKVIFAKYAGTDVTIDGKEYLIMREDDVLGIIH